MYIPGARRRGFTLLEVLLVMAILVILTAVSLPSFQAMYGDTRVRGAGDEVRRAWAVARSRAIDTGDPHRFSVSDSHYRVAPDKAEFWEGAAGGTDSLDDGKVLVGSLPNNIRFAQSSDTPDTGGGWHTVTVFLPDGTCRNDATVKIEADGSGPLFVSVRALTGIVSIKTRKQQEEGR